MKHSEATGDDATRTRQLLIEASQLLGDGQVLLQVVSMPVAEWVFVGVEDDAIVVSDNGETFATITSGEVHDYSYLPWSLERADEAARRFDVEIADEGGEGYDGFRLRRTVRPGESVAGAVQAVARAIDGTFALHTPRDALAFGSFFWDSPDNLSD